MGLPGMIGGFRESPGEIRIAVFGIALALDLLVTGPATGDLATIGSIMAHLFKPFNGSRFRCYSQLQSGVFLNTARIG